jgi:hypothetical protein
MQYRSRPNFLLLCSDFSSASRPMQIAFDAKKSLIGPRSQSVDERHEASVFLTGRFGLIVRKECFRGENSFLAAAGATLVTQLDRVSQAFPSAPVIAGRVSSNITRGRRDRR